MNPRSTIAHHRYTDEVVVEVVVDEGDGEVWTRSVELDVVDENCRRLSPRGDLPAEHAESICRYLDEVGFELGPEIGR